MFRSLTELFLELCNSWHNHLSGTTECQGSLKYGSCQDGHATPYRSLMGELCRQGHEVLFLERDVPWYAINRDLPQPPYGRTELY